MDVLRLAASGAGLDELARQAGVSVDELAAELLSAAKEASRRGLPVDEAREVELAHLDLIRRAMTPTALRGDVQAARVLVRVHEARAALLGLGDARVDRGEGVSVVDELRARRAARRAGEA